MREAQDRQNTSNSDAADLDDTAFSRRGFLAKSVLAGIALAEIACSPKTESDQVFETNAVSAPRITTFEELVKELSQLYTVSDYKKLGDRVVVIFNDAHVASIESINSDRVLKLDDLYDLELVGLENYIEGPKSSKDRATAEKIAAALRFDESQMLELPDANQGITAVSPHSITYDHLFNRPEFRTVPLEKEDLYQKVAIAALAEEIYDVFLEVAGAGYYLPLAHGDKKHFLVLQLERVEAELAKHFSDFPTFDLSRITDSVQVEGEKMIVLSDKSAQYIGERAFRFRMWFLEHAVIPRNREAAARLVDKMDQEGYRRASMIIGKDHTRDHSPLIEGPSVQNILEERNVSYIVVDF
jgi:hypothetical protein